MPTGDPGLLEERDFWRLRTIYGDVDLIYAPRGGGYEDLLPTLKWSTFWAIRCWSLPWTT